jgi:hypothetical protein
MRKPITNAVMASLVLFPSRRVRPAVWRPLVPFPNCCLSRFRRAVVIIALLASAPLAALENCPVQVVHQGHGPVRTLETWSGGGQSLLLAGEGADLVLYDIANPNMPVRLGAIGLSGPVAHIAVRPNGTLAAVSDRRNTISIVDISNRAQPTLLSRYAVPEGRIPRGLAIRGNVLYAAITPAGPASISIANPSAPVLLQQVVTPGTDFVFDIKVSPSAPYVYVADDVEGVTVWEVLGSGSLQQVASYPATGASHLFLDGVRAYVARRDQGYTILDISSPTPTLLGSIGVVGSYSHGALVNGHLVTAAGAGGLRTFNIANPASPVLVSTVSDQANVVGVAGLGTTAWVPTRVATSIGIRAYDLGAPATPAVRSNLFAVGATERVHASGGRVYVPQFPSGLAIFDNSSGSRGALLGRFDAANIYAVTSSGDIAYAVSSLNFGSTLRVLNVADPAAVTQLTSLALPSTAYQMAVQGNRLFIATSGGLRTYDIGTPSAPVLLSNYSAGVLAVLPAGNRLYVGKGDRIEVLDAASPAPSLIGQFITGQPIRDLAQQGNFLYVADGNAEVRVLNIANPTSIAAAGSLDIAPGLAFGLAIDGTRLYVAAGPFWGTVIGNIATPTAPVRVGSLPTPDSVIDIDFADGALIAAEGGNGVRFHSCPSIADPIFASGFE